MRTLYRVPLNSVRLSVLARVFFLRPHRLPPFFVVCGSTSPILLYSSLSSVRERKTAQQAGQASALCLCIPPPAAAAVPRWCAVETLRCNPLNPLFFAATNSVYLFVNSPSSNLKRVGCVLNLLCRQWQRRQLNEHRIAWSQLLW